VTTPVHFKQQLADELAAHATSLSAPAGHRALVRLPRPRAALALGAVAAAAAVAVALPLTSGSHTAQQAAPAPHATVSTGSATSSAAPSPSAPGTGRDIVNADYAVKFAPGGAVYVELFSPRGVPGLQADLRKAGIPAAVMTPSASCHAKIPTDHSGRSNVVKVAPPSRAHRAPDGGLDQLIQPSAIPKGDQLLFVAHFAPDEVQGLAFMLVHEVPSCVS
jgi:hypothetical protein